MPDTFTHIALPSLFYRCFGHRLMIPIVLIGAVLPDYLRELTAIILPVKYYSFVHIFHTFIGAACIALIGASLFRFSQRKMVFLSLFTGQCVHFAVDLIQDYLCPGRFYLLFPWPYSFEFGWIPEYLWLYIFAVSLGSFLIFLVFRFFQINRQNS